jgi:hypothetical protein
MEDYAKFITNCSDKINWDSIIEVIINKPGKDLIPDKSLWNDRNPGYGKLFSLWEDANFNLSSAKWTNYYPGKDYDDCISKQFEDLLQVKHIRSWISRIDPGYCTPWHWDTDDKEDEYLKLGKLKRYSCHISKPAVGNIFIIGKQAHYFWEQGDLYEWNNHRAWHAGINVGLTPKFLFNFLSYV